MNRKITQLLLIVGVLILLVSACNGQPVTGSEPVSTPGLDQLANEQLEAKPVSGVPGFELPASGQLQVQPGSGAPGVEPPAGNQPQVQPMSEGNIDQETSIESSQAFQASAPVEETIDEMTPGDIPSLEERNAMLDRVNLGGPVIVKDDSVSVQGPTPGTESHLAGGETLDDILDKVNPGGPDLSGNDGTIIGGPAMGTESVLAADDSPNVDDVTNPDLFTWIVTALSNWLRGIFSQ